jgi:hypothetical protein
LYGEIPVNYGARRLRANRICFLLKNTALRFCLTIVTVDNVIVVEDLVKINHFTGLYNLKLKIQQEELDFLVLRFVIGGYSNWITIISVKIQFVF